MKKKPTWDTKSVWRTKYSNSFKTSNNVSQYEHNVALINSNALVSTRKIRTLFIKSLLRKLTQKP